MKEPWQKTDDGYRWWRYWITHQEMWRKTGWHVLVGGCGIGLFDTAEEAIAFAEQYARDDLERRFADLNDQMQELYRLSDELRADHLSDTPA